MSKFLHATVLLGSFFFAACVTPKPTFQNFGFVRDADTSAASMAALTSMKTGRMSHVQITVTRVNGERVSAPMALTAVHTLRFKPGKTELLVTINKIGGKNWCAQGVLEFNAKAGQFYTLDGVMDNTATSILVKDSKGKAVTKAIHPKTIDIGTPIPVIMPMPVVR